MSRRYASNGRFRTAAPLESVPLIAAAIHAKCERVSRGNRTRAMKRRAKIMAVCAMLAAEVGAC